MAVPKIRNLPKCVFFTFFHSFSCPQNPDKKIPIKNENYEFDEIPEMRF